MKVSKPCYVSDRCGGESAESRGWAKDARRGSGDHLIQGGWERHHVMGIGGAIRRTCSSNSMYISPWSSFWLEVLDQRRAMSRMGLKPCSHHIFNSAVQLSSRRFHYSISIMAMLQYVGRQYLSASSVALCDVRGRKQTKRWKICIKSTSYI